MGQEGLGGEMRGTQGGTSALIHSTAIGLFFL